MNMKFAIYGFFFNRAFSFNSFYFMPFDTDLSFREKENKSKDRCLYYLTGLIETPELDSDDFIFKMQAVLTFVQQQDVIIKYITNQDIVKSFSFDFERRGSGAPFSMFPALQEEIICKLYNKLIDNNDLCNKKIDNSVFNDMYNCEFSSLLYKVTEPFHMRKNFIEMTYFLYFSGLEAFCKQYIMSYYSDLNSEYASEVIGRTLEKLNINYINVHLPASEYNLKEIITDGTDFIKLSITTYVNLRNSLFHSNKFVADTEISSVKIGDKKFPKQQVRITDYDYNLHRLCNAVILKYIDIDNNELDCSKWYTRFPMIRSR